MSVHCTRFSCLHLNWRSQGSVGLCQGDCLWLANPVHITIAWVLKSCKCCWCSTASIHMRTNAHPSKSSCLSCSRSNKATPKLVCIADFWTRCLQTCCVVSLCVDSHGEHGRGRYLGIAYNNCRSLKHTVLEQGSTASLCPELVEP